MIDLDRLTTLVLTRDPNGIQDLFAEDTAQAVYKGVVKAKERPRQGKGGRMFTPKETRQFEKRVKDWALSLEWPTVRYPIRVGVKIYEETDDNDLLAANVFGLLYNQKGDIDNLGKSILDGLNGVLYKDDKQICSLLIERGYHSEPGFVIAVTRAGLTRLEYENFRKRMKQAAR